MRTCLPVIAMLMLAAPAHAAPDPAVGKTLYESRCGACHSIDTDRVGPRHQGVIGRKAGGVPGYDYSPALKAAKFKWTAAMLDKWLQGPSRLVPGTTMFFTVARPEDRANIIAYLAMAK
jgi:cytochrome c